MKQTQKGPKSSPDSASRSARPVDTQIESKVHPQLMTYTGYCLHKVALRMRARIDERTAKYGLVAPQYAMLTLLKIEGQMTQVELGSYMAMDKATMVRMVDILENEAYVKRSPSRTDRRAKLLTITPSGRKMLKILEALAAEAEKSFLAPFSSAERTEFRRLVIKLMR